MVLINMELRSMQLSRGPIFASNDTDSMSMGRSCNGLGVLNPQDTPLSVATEVVCVTDVVIACLGVLANVGSIAYLLQGKQRRLGTTPHLIALAVSDSLFLGFGVIASTAVFRIHCFYANEAPGWCNVRFYIGIAALSVSNYSLALLASVRAIVVAKPFKGRMWLSRNLNAGLIILVWIISYLQCIPILLAYESHDDCVVLEGWEWVTKYYIPWLQFEINIIPNAVLMVSVGVILRKMRQRRCRVSVIVATHLQVDASCGPFHKISWLAVKLSLFQIGTTIPGIVFGIYASVIGGIAFLSPELLVVAHCIYILGTINHSANAVFYIRMSKSRLSCCYCWQ